MLSGAGALILRRLGIRRRPGGGAALPGYLRWGIAGLLLGLIALNFWQYRQTQLREQDRLQATLIRPASFDGTKIQDATLQETKFDAQKTHPLAITTQDAARLLASSPEETQTLFFDIRETGEHEMGTLPGASHMRFPDFRQAPPLKPGQSAVLFCHNGNRSSETCEALAAQGIDCKFVAGGIEKWIVEGRPFSDAEVTSLADLRAIPEYENRDTLLSTADFTGLLAEQDLQIVDTRYPGDFATGHLPGAINIPIRALPTDELRQRIAALQDKPTIAACYDRRSCFMAQVLGLEMTRAGIDFQGRYTTPWDYFVPPPPKPHVQEWLAEQQKTLWTRAIDGLSIVLTMVAKQYNLVIALLALAVLTRLLILPLAIKAERDQIITAQSAEELAAIKAKLNHDPVRMGRAIQAFYRDKGLTPGRNLLALLFLPITMLGVSSAQKVGVGAGASFLWVSDLGLPDPTYALPLAFSALATVYLVWAVAKTPRQAKLWAALGAPGMFLLVFALTAAATLYLCFALSLLLVQRAYVTGDLTQTLAKLTGTVRNRKTTNAPNGVIPLGQSDQLEEAGNKAYRLSVMSNAGIPVPAGVVLTPKALADFDKAEGEARDQFCDTIWDLAGRQPCAVRSSAANEDGAEQSFAGVFESVLDVDRDGMDAALRHVERSFASQRAKSYEEEGGIGGNILVQQMVDAEYAGVLFTRDPQAPGMSMVEMVRGCGEDLVSGRVTPETFRFGRFSGQGQEGETPPIDLQDLLALGQQIEALFDTPQDIEWTFADGRFQIVQSRDITTLGALSEAETLRVTEWSRLLERFADADAAETVLEQDEMSEVLPRPTPLSFSLMGSLWAPGGSVDLACRDLGVPYDLPEGPNGHLVTVFGRTFVDVRLKETMKLRLTSSQARRLRKRAAEMPESFRSHTLADLHQRLAYWQALDYRKLPVNHLRDTIAELQDYLVHQVYVEAEKVNILAGFAMTEATAAAAGDQQLKSCLMHAELPHAPSAILAACVKLPEEERKHQALQQMGHRALPDYELSAPRYAEAPSLLWPLLDNPVLPLNVQNTPPTSLPGELADVINLAIDLQDLKEQAKHEALRLFAELRRACLALGEATGLEDLIFHLEMDELLTCAFPVSAELIARAETRRDQGKLMRKAPSVAASLSLRDCELASLGEQAPQADGALVGTCVSGEGAVSGRVYWVEDDEGDPETLFADFQDGDILVCRMVSPAWLPWVQRSGAVLSEVGGWLSHMAIVAREKKIMMLVACKGLPLLQDGQNVTVSATGEIAPEQDAARSASVA